jgi:hypothetical protein
MAASNSARRSKRQSIQNIAPKCRMSNIAGGVRLAATAFVAVLGILLQHTAKRIGLSYDFLKEVELQMASMMKLLNHEAAFTPYCRWFIAF